MGHRLAYSAWENFLRENRPDVVHVHSLQGGTLRVPELARSHGARVLWTHHDLFAICPRVHLHTATLAPCDGPRFGAACGPCHGDGLRSFVAAPVFALRTAGFLDAMRKTHHHLAPSRWVRDLLVGHGVPEDRISVVPPAVPRPSRLAELPPDARSVRLVTAGDLRRAKGVDRVIRAVRTVAIPGLRLDVLGGPPTPPAPREEDFETQVRELADAPGIRLLGRYLPPELLPALDGATALVVAPRVRESWGRTLNEALLAGIPVVAPRAGALPEQVEDGVNGALWDPDEDGALERALVRVVDEGLLWQAEADRWPRAWDFARCLAEVERIAEGDAGARTPVGSR
jgi:glycosyltransferase involved in cell wall biosynthesis